MINMQYYYGCMYSGLNYHYRIKGRYAQQLIKLKYYDQCN